MSGCSKGRGDVAIDLRGLTLNDLNLLSSTLGLNSVLWLNQNCELDSLVNQMFARTQKTAADAQLMASLVNFWRATEGNQDAFILSLDIITARERGEITIHEAFQIFNFIETNNWSQNTIDFGFWYLSFEALSQNPCGLNHDCVQSIRTMADGLRRLHGEEGILMAEYFESLIGDLDSLTMGDLQIFYDTAKQITDQYNDHMFYSIIGAYAEGLLPILEIALYEVGGTLAIKMIQKIPLSWVLRGTRLNNMVKKVGLLGEVGTSNNIRIVTTGNAPISKARELFNKLTQNAVSITTQSNGAMVANMGNGNFITFRNLSQSGSNFAASINLDFPSIWSNVRVLKFKS